MNFLYLFSVKIALAQGPSQIPVGNPDVSVPVGLQAYVTNLFQTAFLFAGVIAFGAIVYSAVRYTLAAANPSQKSDAKDGIVNALLGLLLLLGAGIILTVINPEISKIKLPPLKQLQAMRTGTPVTVTPGTGLADAVARAQLTEHLGANGIKDNVNLAGFQQSSVNEIISLKQACNCEVVLTSAVRPVDPSQGTCQHGYGYKFDLRLTTSLNGFIEGGQGGFYPAGYRHGPHGGPRYMRNGAEYVKESDHWDVAVCS